MSIRGQKIEPDPDLVARIINFIQQCPSNDEGEDFAYAARTLLGCVQYSECSHTAAEEAIAYLEEEFAVHDLHSD
jgi:hypothetical protein